MFGHGHPAERSATSCDVSRQEHQKRCPEINNDPGNKGRLGARPLFASLGRIPRSEPAAEKPSETKASPQPPSTPSKVAVVLFDSTTATLASVPGLGSRQDAPWLHTRRLGLDYTGDWSLPGGTAALRRYCEEIDQTVGAC